jgi:hypothetical protein
MNQQKKLLAVKKPIGGISPKLPGQCSPPQESGGIATHRPDFPPFDFGRSIIILRACFCGHELRGENPEGTLPSGRSHP